MVRAYAVFLQGLSFFMAGVFNSFTHASLFIALSDSPLIRCIFRRVPDPPSRFCIHNYLFEFTHRGGNEDILNYNISCGDFQMRFTIYGIETTANCDTYSNLDCVTFIWQNFDHFNFVRYALTHVRRDYLALPEMLCLKYYRAESAEWRNDILCGPCIARFQSRFQHATSCLRTADCRCTVCVRQPPSLASYNLFRLIFEIRMYVLCWETTYHDYVMAIRSRRVPTHPLLPPDFPDMSHFPC